MLPDLWTFLEKPDNQFYEIYHLKNRRAKQSRSVACQFSSWTQNIFSGVPSALLTGIQGKSSGLPSASSRQSPDALSGAGSLYEVEIVQSGPRGEDGALPWEMAVPRRAPGNLALMLFLRSAPCPESPGLGKPRYPDWWEKPRPCPVHSKLSSSKTLPVTEASTDRHCPPDSARSGWAWRGGSCVLHLLAQPPPRGPAGKQLGALLGAATANGTGTEGDCTVTAQRKSGSKNNTWTKPLWTFAFVRSFKGPLTVLVILELFSQAHWQRIYSPGCCQNSGNVK